MYRIQKVNSHYEIQNNDFGYWFTLDCTLTLIGAYSKLQKMLRDDTAYTIATFDKNGKKINE